MISYYKIEWMEWNTVISMSVCPRVFLETAWPNFTNFLCMLLTTMDNGRENENGEGGNTRDVPDIRFRFAGYPAVF